MMGRTKAWDSASQLQAQVGTIQFIDSPSTDGSDEMYTLILSPRGSNVKPY